MLVAGTDRVMARPETGLRSSLVLETRVVPTGCPSNKTHLPRMPSTKGLLRLSEAVAVVLASTQTGNTASTVELALQTPKTVLVAQ